MYVALEETGENTSLCTPYIVQNASTFNIIRMMKSNNDGALDGILIDFWWISSITYFNESLFDKKKSKYHVLVLCTCCKCIQGTTRMYVV